MDVYWLEQNTGDVPEGDDWLSRSECTRLEKLFIPKRRADWRLGRWTAKCALATYWGTPRDSAALAAMELRPEPSGAPEVFRDGRPMKLPLSLSHSSATGLCAIAPEAFRLGCDLEIVAPRSQAFLADFFTDGEQKLVALAPDACSGLLVTLLWSVKESALKALGCGLRADTRSVIAVLEGLPAILREHQGRLCATHTNGGTLRGCWWESGGLVRTIVAEPEPRRIVALEPGEIDPAV